MSFEVTSSSNYPVILWSWWDTGCSISLHWGVPTRLLAWVTTYGTRVRETEAHTSAASFCAGNVPLPPSQHPPPPQGAQQQECKGRAIKGSVIKPQQS